MTDYNDHSKLKHDSLSNMDALKAAIVNKDEERLKALLTDMLLDELQKSYLINLSEHRGNSEITMLIRGVPATP